MKKIFATILLAVVVLTTAFSADRPTVAVVLSGGGAKGIAHVAILEKLEDLGIPIDRVYGTSMGALVGGIYCAGYTPREIEKMMLENDLSTLFNSLLSSGYNEVLEPFDFNRNNILSLSLDKGIGDVSGLIDDYMILNYLYSYIGNIPDNIDFDKDLPISYRCNATNMLNGEDHVFSSGSLIDAIRASISIPIVFEPVVLGGAVYMDGGLADNMPVHLAIEDGYDIVIAVAVNRTEDFTPDHYNSFSGTLDGTIEIAIKRGSLGEKDLATLYIRVDTSSFTTLGFNKAAQILEKGKEDVAKYEEQLQAIADMFTEDQKVYKNPNRRGEYFSRFDSNNDKISFSAAKDYKQEELHAKSRVALGVYGGGGYSFSLNKAQRKSQTLITGVSQFKFYPAVSLRLYLKDKKVDILSYDLRLKGEVNRNLSIDATVLARITEDTDERIFVTGEILGRAGTLSSDTDPTGTVSFNYTDFSLDSVMGLKVTDELSHVFNLRFRARNTWMFNVYADIDEGMSLYKYTFLPSVQIDGLIYPDYKTGLFGNKGTRIDFIANVGFEKAKDSKWNLTYILKGAVEHEFELNKSDSIWVDATVSTHRGPEGMRDFYEEYGGWDGLPGYNYGSLTRDSMFAGIGYQRALKTGMISSYLQVEVRAGLRSEDFYDFWPGAAESKTPFYECFNGGHWDLGLGVGYGFSTPIGDILVGVGINKDLLVSFYFEVK